MKVSTAVKKNDVAIQTETEDLEKILRDFVVDKKLTDSELKNFISVAKAFHLNPFKREIHIVAFGEGDKRQCSILTGYEVYIKRAERTGKLRGWKVESIGDTPPDLKAKVTIYRSDWDVPFEYTASYRECVQERKDYRTGQKSPNSFWVKMPQFMLKKVAIAQGFRLCFSDELGGMPYTQDEMPEIERPSVAVKYAGKADVEMPKERIKKEVINETTGEITEIDEKEEYQQPAEKETAPADNTEKQKVLEVKPSMALYVESGGTIPSIKGYIRSAAAFVSNAGKTCTAIELSDTESEVLKRPVIIRYIGDKVGDFYQKTFYRFFDVKVMNSKKDDSKIFIGGKYEQIISGLNE
ncbi:MAG: phage recombination protein Bet [Elusimicrobiota bacterium]|jgi:phage recombination protein Bet|nr:phage recombination protein Bet [Elusimicrobiota bacterium]